ncbi:uncharacterized protein CPUR_08816 [Claviceps purpurea 20.1]|uniref:Uncharacterized protein n=1 Tax=Claviceps purpurea (strain 20.1) TaxID=1111077 RepID=M1VZE4_CLAP2|nr:uncharacterized protein CPUR_08816 [Claviceps purpurea 20.1]
MPYDLITSADGKQKRHSHVVENSTGIVNVGAGSSSSFTTLL